MLSDDEGTAVITMLPSPRDLGGLGRILSDATPTVRGGEETGAEQKKGYEEDGD